VNADRPGSRPPHLIAPSEVDAWLADSAVKTVTYHRTSRDAARAIVERGVRVERSRIGAYGQGFYTATRTDEFYGEVELGFAVRLRAPLVGSAEEVGRAINRLVRRFDPIKGELSPPVARSVRRELLSSGYDGLVVRDAEGDGVDYVIALFDEVVRVVIEP